MRVNRGSGCRRRRILTDICSCSCRPCCYTRRVCHSRRSYTSTRQCLQTTHSDITHVRYQLSITRSL